MLTEYNRGTRLLQTKKYDKAIQCFRRELNDVNFKECWLNLGNAYRQLGKLSLAKHAYEQAADPMMPYADNRFGEYGMAINNLGLMQYTIGNDDAAIEYYERALQVEPGLVDAMWNYASAALRKLCSRQQFDEAKAWRMYSYRFQRVNPTHLDRTLPLWDGISKHDKIVVLTEQGYGDKLQFSRYLPQMREYCNHVIVQTPEEMRELYEPEYETCDANLLATNAQCSVPLGSLAQKFGISTNNYMWFKHKVVPHQFNSTKKNIIIEWQGSKTHSNDHNRSCNVGYFNFLQDYGNVLNIRPDSVAPKWVKTLNSSSWLQSAEYVLGCDLVITIDTSLVHLAGSLGVPTILLQPKIETDFRWGNDAIGMDNVWYPTVKVIRNPNSWEHVFKQVKQLLDNGQVL